MEPFMTATAPTDIINSVTPLETGLVGIHPRLYASDANFKRLRQQIKQEPYASLLARVVRIMNAYPCIDSYRTLPGDIRGYGCLLPNLALLWKLTGDRSYFKRTCSLLDALTARTDWSTDLIFGHFAHGAAVAWDWLYHDLPRPLRERVADRLVGHGRVFFKEWADYNHFAAFAYTWNHMAVPLTGLAAIACALYGERPGLAPWMKMAIEKTRLMTDSLGPDGVSPEGIAYGQYHAEYLARTNCLLKKMAGIDFLSDSAWWKNYAVASLYHTYPRKHWRNKEIFFMLGDADRHHWLGPDPVLRLCARTFRDGYAQWLADELHRADAATDHSAFLNLLWHDPTVPPQRPQALPRIRHFADQDIAILRSGWDGRESVLAFKCGPHSGHHNLRYNHNVSGGHMLPMAGGIALFAQGDFLLVESGYPKKKTEYENTLLVNGQGQIGEGGDWFEDIEFRRGHPTPRMLEVGQQSGVDFAIGDATAAYLPNARLKKFIRHIYAIAPDCWILVDEVEAAVPSTFTLLFHGDKPFIAESERGFLQCGERGTLRIQSLEPVGVTGQTEMQDIEGTGGSKRNPPKGLLRLVTNKKLKRTVFVTFLHAYPTGSRPTVTATVHPRGGKMVVKLQQAGSSRSFVFNINLPAPEWLLRASPSGPPRR
jgi:hypothetical protein